MWHYTPPLRDMRFVIDEVLQLPARWAHMPAFAELDSATAHQVIEEAGRFAAEVIGPLNAPGDQEGCTLQADGSVTTPRGFREAYQAFVAAGWPALACSPEAGGQGLPQVLNAALYEMLNAANHAWTMYPGLLHGAYESLHAHASPELKAAYLGRVVSGEWLATMCLTEAHAGSDLGLLRTRAEPQPDGAYQLTGSKIFISGGEHELTDNIVHMVLARISGAPAGTKGLSLFLVPKWLPDGSRNGVRCTGVEKKMGIKGSATCQMSFEAATGWLVGEAGRGLAVMFVMMNAARLQVGLQGLAHAEAAYQNSERYAQERLQMRAVQRPADAPGSSAVADPIAWHPAMRHKLLRQRALLEAGRLLAYETAHRLDEAEQAGDPQAQDDLALLTPVVKAFLTDNGFQSACEAQQVFGGHGYIHEMGAEQCVRDSRIARIYEGTNEIQAIDLLVRKILPDGGQRLGRLLDRLEAELPATDLAQRVRPGLAGVRARVRELADAAVAQPELPLNVADDLLRLLGLVLFAHGWARMDAVAAAGQGDAGFYADKRATARYFMDFIWPEAALCEARIQAGHNPLPALHRAPHPTTA